MQHHDLHLRNLTHEDSEVEDHRKKSSVTVHQPITCGICFEQPPDTEKTILIPCRHVFCWSCVSQLKNYSKKCPLCRAKFTQFRLALPEIIFVGSPQDDHQPIPNSQKHKDTFLASRRQTGGAPSSGSGSEAIEIVIIP